MSKTTTTKSTQHETAVKSNNKKVNTNQTSNAQTKPNKPTSENIAQTNQTQQDQMNLFDIDISDKLAEALQKNNIDLTQINKNLIMEAITDFWVNLIVGKLKLNSLNSIKSNIAIKQEKVDFDGNLINLGKRLGESLQKALI